MFRTLKELTLPKKQYVIVGGAVLEAYGLRQTEELDIVVSTPLFEEYYQRDDWVPMKTVNGQWKLKKRTYENQIKKVELHLDLSAPHFSPSFEELVAHATPIHGFSFLSPHDLLCFKIAYGKPRDREDIALLRALLHGKL